jgi:hypothetical protein
MPGCAQRKTSEVVSARRMFVKMLRQAIRMIKRSSTRPHYIVSETGNWRTSDHSGLYRLLCFIKAKAPSTLMGLRIFQSGTHTYYQFIIRPCCYTGLFAALLGRSKIAFAFNPSTSVGSGPELKGNCDNLHPCAALYRSQLIRRSPVLVELVPPDAERGSSYQLFCYLFQFWSLYRMLETV